ncbi:MAG TPA: hypothetical protein VF121_10520 [Thermoanaerobaculia bacterium]|nr:hypothetical protein [Thermoanaerobaculia bacterium]
MRAVFLLSLTALFLIGAPAADANGQANPTTQPGLFWTINNACSRPVSGFAVGDKLCLLQVGTATFTRAIFQGTMVPGEKKFAMACAGADGNGVVLFVPAIGMPIQAVQVTVRPNQVVDIPQTFCGAPAAEEPGGQFRNQ